MVITLIILNAIDLAQTLWALPTGMFAEGNSVALALYNYSPWAMIGYKVIGTAVACWLMHKCRQQVGNHWSLYIPIALMVLVVSWNFLNIALYLGDL